MLCWIGRGERRLTVLVKHEGDKRSQQRKGSLWECASGLEIRGSGLKTAASTVIAWARA